MVSFQKNILKMKDREFYVFYQEGESSYDDIIKVNTIRKTEGLTPEEYLSVDAALLCIGNELLDSNGDIHFG